eukprot:542954-Amphidinium_carterae.1
MVAANGPGLMRKLCGEALTEKCFSRGDVLFNAGEALDKMCFIECGVLEYMTMRVGRQQESTLLTPTDHF